MACLYLLSNGMQSYRISIVVTFYYMSCNASTLLFPIRFLLLNHYEVNFHNLYPLWFNTCKKTQRYKPTEKSKYSRGRNKTIGLVCATSWSLHQRFATQNYIMIFNNLWTTGKRSLYLYAIKSRDFREDNTSWRKPHVPARAKSKTFLTWLCSTRNLRRVCGHPFRVAMV